MSQEPGQFWREDDYPDSTWQVTRVWKNSILMVNMETGTTMRASNRHGMTTDNGWRCIGGLLPQGAPSRAGCLRCYMTSQPHADSCPQGAPREKCGCGVHYKPCPQCDR